MIDKINKEIEELGKGCRILLSEGKNHSTYCGKNNKCSWCKTKLEQAKKDKKIIEEELYDDFIELKSLAQFCEKQHINEELGVRDLRHLKSRIDEIINQKLKNQNGR